MLKNIIFDLGNVIIKWDAKEVVSHCVDKEEEIEILYEAIFMSDGWLKYDEGTIEKEQLIKSINVRLDDCYHQIVRNIITDWYRYCPIIEGMEDLMKELKDRGYKIYLLSNTNLSFDEYKDTIPALAYFDGYYISAVRKLIKPFKEVYLDFLELYKLKAEESLFIDDTLINVVGAKEVGIDGYHFVGDVEKLREFIVGYDV